MKSRRHFIFLCAAALSGCAKVPPAGLNHPANPGAAAATLPDLPATLSLEAGSPRATTSTGHLHQGHPSGAPAAATAGETLYSCPMHPEVVSDKPGKCPKCGMELRPKAAGKEAEKKHVH